MPARLRASVRQQVGATRQPGLQGGAAARLQPVRRQGRAGPACVTRTRPWARTSSSPRTPASSTVSRWAASRSCSSTCGTRQGRQGGPAGCVCLGSQHPEGPAATRRSGAAAVGGAPQRQQVAPGTPLPSPLLTSQPPFGNTSPLPRRLEMSSTSTPSGPGTPGLKRTGMELRGKGGRHSGRDEVTDASSRPNTEQPGQQLWTGGARCSESAVLRHQVDILHHAA